MSACFGLFLVYGEIHPSSRLAAWAVAWVLLAWFSDFLFDGTRYLDDGTTNGS